MWPSLPPGNGIGNELNDMMSGICFNKRQRKRKWEGGEQGEEKEAGRRRRWRRKDRGGKQREGERKRRGGRKKGEIKVRGEMAM